MSDAALILRLSKAIEADRDRPVVNQQVNPTDPVAIEIVLHEGDFAVDTYMEKWTALYRDKFEDPSVFDHFVFEFQMIVRREIKAKITASQQIIAAELEEPEEGDEDESV